MASFRSDVPSYLQFVGLRRSVMIYSDLELVFKPLAADGDLLYSFTRMTASSESDKAKIGNYADDADEWSFVV